MLRMALELAGDVAAVYASSNEQIKRGYNQAFFKKLHITPQWDDDHEQTAVRVSRAELTKPYAVLLDRRLPSKVLNEVELIRQASPTARSGPNEPLPDAGCSIFFKLAERAGFEPAMEFDPHTRLAGECLQPLGHLSRGRTSQSKASAEARRLMRGRLLRPPSSSVRSRARRFQPASNPASTRRSPLALAEPWSGMSSARPAWTRGVHGFGVSSRSPRLPCRAPVRSTSLVGVARRGGRAVECGSLENCFGGNPSDEGSNPSPSASLRSKSQHQEAAHWAASWCCGCRRIRPFRLWRVAQTLGRGVRLLFYVGWP
jgi:hypothetical protein